MSLKIGEVICAQDPIVLNAGRATREIAVTNKGDRPVQVGSHFHFFEVNRCLSFDRAQAYGYKLDIPSGNSVRFEPGEEKVVRLVEMGGTKTVYGLNDLTRAQAVERTADASLEKARRRGFTAYDEAGATGFAAGWDEGVEGVDGPVVATPAPVYACGSAAAASCCAQAAPAPAHDENPTTNREA